MGGGPRVSASRNFFMPTPAPNIGTHQRSFKRYHSRPPRSPLPVDRSFRNPTQNSNRKLWENECTQRNSLYGRPIRVLGEQVVWASQGLPEIFGYPYYPIRDGKATDFKFGRYIHRLKIFDKRERGRVQGLPNFWVPLLFQQRVKPWTSNFVRTCIFAQVDRNNKPPMKNSGKSIAVGVIRGLENFQDTDGRITAQLSCIINY